MVDRFRPIGAGQSAVRRNPPDGPGAAGSRRPRRRPAAGTRARNALPRARGLCSVVPSVLALLLAPAMAPVAAAESRGGTVVEAVCTETVLPADIRRLAGSFFEGFGASQARFAVRVYRLRFLSTDLDGSEAPIEAQLFVPFHAWPAGRPILVFGSGTTGIADDCAPSREQPEVRRWGYYRANMLAYAGEGFITVFPDYLGFNDEQRCQRYFSKAAEAHVMLDAVRAVYRFFAANPLFVRPSGAVFAAGYSQGGHAAFAAADLQSEYAPEVPLTGVIGFGSTNDVTTLLKEGPCYAPYILHTYAELYGSAEIDPGEYLQASWASSLDDDVNRMCVDQFQSYYPANAQRLYRPEFYRSLYGGTLPRDYPRLHARLAENSSGLAGHRLPALMVQGLDDSVITTPSQNRFVRELSVAGSPVRYVRLAGVRHRNTRAAGFRLSVEWMEGLARGEPPVSDWTLADP